MAAADAIAKPKRHLRPPNLAPYKRTSVVVGLLAAAGLVALVASGPRFDLLLGISPVIQIHLAAAVTAFVLGGVLLLARKGRAFHRIAGWTWVGVMGTVAFASLFITEINDDWWSWIHILSGSTLLMLPLAVRAAKKHNLRTHRSIMFSLYIGGMLIAGGFTFLPGRLMREVFFS